MPDFIGAIDQGTTSTRFLVFDRAGRIVASAQREHQQIYPQPGWVEHDPLEIWATQLEVARGGVAAAGVGVGSGVVSTRTMVVWGGKPSRTWATSRM